METTQDTNKLLTDELYELTLRAKRINYKNKPPKFPKNPTTSTISGFRKRFSNWKTHLHLLEQELERGTINRQVDLLQNYLRK